MQLNILHPKEGAQRIHCGIKDYCLRAFKALQSKSTVEYSFSFPTALSLTLMLGTAGQDRKYQYPDSSVREELENCTKKKEHLCKKLEVSNYAAQQLAVL